MTTPQDTKTKSGFPYKTLIWALLALVAIFLFKTELKDLLSKADEVSLFGIELKVGKDKALALENAIQKYEDEISAFNAQVTEQQEQIAQLERLKDNLRDDIANCPEARENAVLLNTEFTRIMTTNEDIKRRSSVIENAKIFKRANFQPLIDQ